MNIYVGNLPFETTEDDLKELFGAFGTVESANVIRDRHTGRSRGFGFVEIEGDEAGEAAIEALDEKDYNGRNLKVNKAKPRPERRDDGGGGRY